MPTPPDPSTWPERRFHVMGCQMSVRLAVDVPAAVEPLAQVEALFTAAERRLSRFDANSELSRLNACAGHWVGVSSLLWEVLAAALAMAKETDGIFDPAVLPALEAVGYTRPFDQIQTGALAAAVDARPHAAGWSSGQYSRIERRRLIHAVRLPVDTKLDFGGIAKGYMAQQAVDFLRRWGGALVDAGGDLVAGDGPPGFPGWPVAVAAPDGFVHGSGADLAMLWLANATVATSGIDFRTWQRHGQAMHHIIDPATGQPAKTDLMSVTVLSPDAVRAEAWAKVALILGQQRGAAALADRNLAAVLAGRDGHVAMTPAMLSWLATPEADMSQLRLVG